MAPEEKQPVGIVVENIDVDVAGRLFDELAGGSISLADAGPGFALLNFEVRRGPDSYIGIVYRLTAYNRLVRDRRLRQRRPVASVYGGRLRYGEADIDGRETFRSVGAIFQAGFGDCAELVAARCAEPSAIARGALPHIELQGCRREGGCLYHVTVKFKDGSTEDPSALLGMRPMPRSNSPWQYRPSSF